MAEKPDNPLDTGLVYEDLLPLRWSLADTRAPEALAHLQETNEEFMHVLATVEDYVGELPEEHAPLAQHLTRMEAKLTLLLDMVAQIVAGQQRLPEPVPVRLGSRGMQWRTQAAPAQGDDICIELFLAPRFPRPLILPARVTAVETVDGDRQVTVSFRELGDPVSEWLEKTIFRHHRRSVAHARKETKQTGNPA